MSAALSPVGALSAPRRGCAVGLLTVSVATMRLRIGFARIRECNQHNCDATPQPYDRRVTDRPKHQIPGRSGMAGGKRNSPCAAFHVSKPAPRVCGRDTRRTHGCLSAPYTTIDDGLALPCPGKVLHPDLDAQSIIVGCRVRTAEIPGTLQQTDSASRLLRTLRHGCVCVSRRES